MVVEAMHVIGKSRQQLLAAQARGLVLDVGYGGLPNPYLDGAIGLDLKNLSRPVNYEGVIQGDVAPLPVAAESIDTVVAGEIIEHLENPSQFLCECFRVLRMDGRLVLSTPNPYFPPLALAEMFELSRFYVDNTHLHLFPARILKRLLCRCSFQVIGHYSVGFEANFSSNLTLVVPLHRSMACYTILVARKAFS
jgi:SAM-dependent methyltransferase